MTPPLQLQLGIELTKLFPLRQAVDGAVAYIVGLVRDLRKSGSDFLVEEEMAGIFGRGRINRDLEDKFKEEVIKGAELVGLPHSKSTSSKVYLDSTLGPTLERAFTNDPTKVYLATIIQLSLLTWMHDRESLATCLTECMEARYQAGAPGATENSGTEAILGTLDTCASQTGAFQWSRYVNYLEHQILSIYPGFRHEPHFTTLTPKLFLACMDYLYIIQRLPEDRILMLDSHHGFIVLIIWAHFCLDLRVLLSGTPGGDIAFGVDAQKSAQVIIKWGDLLAEPAVCLYDRDRQIVLEADDPGPTSIEPCERLPFEDYGTIFIWRRLNTETTTVIGSPLYSEAVQFVLGSAIAKLPHLYRFTAGPESEPCGRLDIQRWQVYEVAKVMFASMRYNVAEIEQYAQRIDGQQPLIANQVPPALKSFWGKRREIYLHQLAAIVIIFASVSGIKDCPQLPLRAETAKLFNIDFFSDLFEEPGPHIVGSTDMYYMMATTMLGNSNFALEERGTGDSSFMVSEYGWTLLLSSAWAQDPALVVPERLFMRKGVPTKQSSKERRLRVRDGDHAVLGYNMYEILDRGEYFIPRCVEHVSECVEYCGTTKTDFRLSLRYNIGPCRPSEYVGATHFALQTSFRRFHDYLWTSMTTPICEHGSHLRHTEERIPLPLSVAAGTGMIWPDEEDEEETTLPERIVVALVHGESPARWLAVSITKRNVMIRGKSTCVSCAINSAAILPGKWLVII